MSMKINTKIRISVLEYNYDKNKLFDLSLITLAIQKGDFEYINPIFQVVNSENFYYLKFFWFSYGKNKG